MHVLKLQGRKIRGPNMGVGTKYFRIHTDDEQKPVSVEFYTLFPDEEAPFGSFERSDTFVDISLFNRAIIRLDKAS